MAVTDIIGHQVIDLTNDANYYFEVAPQGDSQSRYVEVRVLDNGVPFPIDVGSTVIIEGKNAGGYNIFNSCSLSQDYNNSIIIPLKNGILSFAGVGKYQVVIYNGNEYVESFPFNIVVTEAPYDIERLEGSDSYEALNMAIAQALSANRWWVENGLPTVTVTEGFNKGDYYLDALTGNVYIADYNSSQVVVWKPVMDSSGENQVNIISKIHIRYADGVEGYYNPSDQLFYKESTFTTRIAGDTTHIYISLGNNTRGVYKYNTSTSKFSLDTTGANITPYPTTYNPSTGTLVGKTHIGFFNTVNGDSNNPNNYQWSLMHTTIDTANTVVSYAQTTTTTPPASSAYSTTMPSVLISGGYMWTKVHIAFIDGVSTEYVTMNKNGRGVDHMEVTKDEGQQSLGEKAFRFVYDYVLVIPVGNENPSSLGWYVYNGSAYVLTSDTQVVAGTNYYTKGATTQTISVYNGAAAGFGTPTATMNDGGAPSGAPSATVTTNSSSPDTAKIFNFGFKVRGAQWKTGGLISGLNSTITSSDFNSSNTVIGDLYLNTQTAGSVGRLYICTNVTSNNSTWENTGFVINVIQDASELKNTERFYLTLNSGSKEIDTYISALNNEMFNSLDAANSNIDYRVRVLSNDPTLVLIRNFIEISGDKTVANSGEVRIYLKYKHAPSQNTAVCVEIIKKDRST